MDLGAIFLFWLPLAGMWILMAVEQPIINAAITRQPEPTVNLAAFGITFAISLIIEGPVVQLLTAGTALSTSLGQYKRLLSFTHVLGLGLSLLHLIIGLSPLYAFITRTVMGVPEHLIDISRAAFIVMAPWTGAIAYRRLWQGVLIRYGKTAAIPVTMAIRLGCSLLVLFTVPRFFPETEGALLGAIALSAGVIAGAVAAFGFTRGIVKKEIPAVSEETKDLDYKDLVRFYLPLALTSFIILAVRPLLSMGIAKAPFPVKSLAVWPVLMSFIFIFNSMALSFQEVVVSLMANPNNRSNLKRFATILSMSLGFLYLIVVLTPLADFWFKDITGLEEELLPFTLIPSLILILSPLVLPLTSLYRGFHVTDHRTKIIAQAVIVNMLTLVGILFPGVLLFHLPGVNIAAAAFVASFLTELIYLRVRLNLY